MEQETKLIIKEYQKKITPIIGRYLKNKKILDAGCGNGLNSFFFHQKYHSKIILLDYKDIRDREALSFPFFKSSVERLPFKIKYFDVVFVQYLLHHLSYKVNLKQVFKEFKRVAKIIIIVEEIITSKTNKQRARKFDAKLNKIIHPSTTMRIYKYYSDQELKHYFKQANLKIVKEKVIDRGNDENGFLQRKIYILK